MKIEVTKKELKAIMDCVTITDRTLTGQPLLSFMCPSELVRRLGKIDLNALWYKLRNLND